MKKSLFDELVTSIEEAGRIKRGKAKPSRRYDSDDVKVKSIPKGKHGTRELY